MGRICLKHRGWMTFWKSHIVANVFLVPGLTCEPSAFMEQGMFRKFSLLLWTVSNPLSPAQKANLPLGPYVYMGTVCAAVSEAKTLRARCSQLSNSFLLDLSCLWFELSV